MVVIALCGGGDGGKRYLLILISLIISTLAKKCNKLLWGRRDEMRKKDAFRLSCLLY